MLDSFNMSVLWCFFFLFSQRDDVIRALDQAAGISFNTRTKRLSYSHYSSQKPGEMGCTGQEMATGKNIQGQGKVWDFFLLGSSVN